MLSFIIKTDYLACHGTCADAKNLTQKKQKKREKKRKKKKKRKKRKKKKGGNVEKERRKKKLKQEEGKPICLQEATAEMAGFPRNPEQYPPDLGPYVP